MAVVVPSSARSLPFIPNIYEWPHLSEHCPEAVTRHRHDLTAEKRSQEFYSPAEARSGSNGGETTEDISQKSSHVFSQRSDKVNANKQIQTGSDCLHNCACVCVIYVNTSGQHKEKLSNSPERDNISQSVSKACSRFDNERLENSTLEFTNEDVGEKSANISEIFSSKKRRKKLKKIRTKSTKKWRPYESADIGFHISRMPCLPQEMVDIDKDLTNNAACLEFVQTEKSEHNVVTYHEESANINNITQNEQDDIQFFSALGIDVLNYDDFSAFLDWDNVHFPENGSKIQTPTNPKCFTKSRVRSRLKSPTSSQTGTSTKLNSSKIKNNEQVLSPNVTLPGIKKCDRYKLYELECKSSRKIYIRSDKHRRRTKIHKAVKSKNTCSLFNNKGHKRLYMHHRLVKMHNLDLDFRGSVKYYGVPPMPKKNAAVVESKKDASSSMRIKPERVHDHPAPVQSLKHALHETSDPGNLESDLSLFLISLQHRDVTPEDYDMLLRLDDSLQPKTVSQTVLNKLRTEKIGTDFIEQNSGGETVIMCAVCMEPYEVGQERKFLPCGHDFHSSCIDLWLKNSSMNCPLDGLPISS